MLSVKGARVDQLLEKSSDRRRDPAKIQAANLQIKGFPPGRWRERRRASGRAFSLRADAYEGPGGNQPAGIQTNPRSA